jgi:hypothetical protein
LEIGPKIALRDRTKIQQPMPISIQVMDQNRHIYMVGINWLIGSQPSPSSLCSNDTIFVDSTSKGKNQSDGKSYRVTAPSHDTRLKNTHYICLINVYWRWYKIHWWCDNIFLWLKYILNVKCYTIGTISSLVK